MSAAFSGANFVPSVLLDLQRSFAVYPILLKDRYAAALWKSEIVLAVKSQGAVNWNIMETPLEKREELVASVAKDIIAHEERIRSWNLEVSVDKDAESVSARVKDRAARAKKNLDEKKGEEKDVFWVKEVRDRIEIRAIALQKFLRDCVRSDVSLMQLLDEIDIGDVGRVWLTICKELFIAHPLLTKDLASANFKSDIYARQQFISNAFQAEKFVVGQHSVQEFASRLLSYKVKYSSVGMELVDGVIALKFRQEMEKVYPYEMTIALTKSSFSEMWKYLDDSVRTRQLTGGTAVSVSPVPRPAPAPRLDSSDPPSGFVNISANYVARHPPGFDLKCYGCGGRGHKVAACPNPWRKNANRSSGENENRRKSTRDGQINTMIASGEGLPIFAEYED